MKKAHQELMQIKEAEIEVFKRQKDAEMEVLKQQLAEANRRNASSAPNPPLGN